MIGSSARHILLVEDSQTQAARARLVLENAGYRVTIATDGEAAWKRIGIDAFDIIVSDINMPVMDGYELCRRAKAHPTESRIPFVLLTDHEELTALVRGLEVGADDFILKPWTPTGLVGRIAVVLRDTGPTGAEAAVGSIERMTGLLMGRTKELEDAHRESERDQVQLQVLNNELEVERSQLKASNEQLKLALKQLVAAIEHKSEFLAKMSHELRTPLTAILGFTDLLLDQDRGYGAAKQHAFLSQVRSAGGHLLDLINDLLDLAKVEAGKMEIEHKRLGLSEVLEESAAVIGGMADLKQIGLTVVVPHDDVIVVGDKKRLKQVVINLLSNAVKFTPSKGKVILGLEAADELARVWVEDSGSGIAVADQERIFQEFQQVKGTASEFAGTGLGLALCRFFVELHAGTIGVRSELGMGSTFAFTLPLAPPGETATRAESSARSQVQREPKEAVLKAT
jgi:signal transduction histidine kinase